MDMPPQCRPNPTMLYVFVTEALCCHADVSVRGSGKKPTSQVSFSWWASGAEPFMMGGRCSPPWQLDMVSLRKPAALTKLALRTNRPPLKKNFKSRVLVPWLFIYGFDFNLAFTLGSMYFSTMSIVTITDVRLSLFSSWFVSFGANGMGTHRWTYTYHSRPLPPLPSNFLLGLFLNIVDIPSLD